MRNKIKLALVALLLITAAISAARKINLVTADLGRHIKNGELAIRHGRIIKTNFYSYTCPDFPVVTHHWGSGVVYYLIHQRLRFKGLSLLNILLLTLTVWFIYRSAVLLYGDWHIPLLLVILVLPLITYRTEVRPEFFSYLFLSVSLFTMIKYTLRQLKFYPLLVAGIVMQLLWVNMHIFFPFGIMIPALFSIDYWLRGNLREARKLFVLVCLLVLVSFINPWGWKGVVTPFDILKEYGYMVAENQPVWFMQSRFPDGVFIWFEIIFCISLVSFIPVIIRKNRQALFISLLLWIAFGALAWLMIRNIPLFGMMVVITLTYNLRNISIPIRGLTEFSLTTGAAVLLILSLCIKNRFFSAIDVNTGIGLTEFSEKSAKFYKQAGIRGPVFNNYDIGSYLIYHFAPQKKVFVDNRPEAYPVSFFKEIYNPILENDATWKAMDKKYDFNVIYFYRHDMTTHGQPFLIRRITDPEWAPVYVDDATLILLKRNADNELLIKRFELPREVFRIKKH